MKRLVVLFLTSALVMTKRQHWHEADSLGPTSCTTQRQLDPVRDPLELGLFFRQTQAVLPEDLASQCMFWRRIRLTRPRWTTHRRRLRCAPFRVATL